MVQLVFQLAKIPADYVVFFFFGSPSNPEVNMKLIHSTDLVDLSEEPFSGVWTNWEGEMSSQIVFNLTTC